MADERLPARVLFHSQLWFRGTGKCFETATSHMQTVRNALKRQLLDRIKYTLRILSTNWVHLVGFYVTTYLSLILFKLIGLEVSANEGWNEILFLSLLTIPLLFFTYGLLIIGGFLGAIAILDTIGFNLSVAKVKLILVLEWLILIPPFINWAFEYEYWLWLTLTISFAITQWIRKPKIERINKNALQQRI